MYKGLVLAVDVDSTVWDSVAFYREAIEEMGLVVPSVAEIDTWEYFYTRYGSEAANDIFARALHPDRITSRTLYPNAARIIRKLQREWHMRIIFITHNHDPEAMVVPLSVWLRSNFGDAVGVCVLHGSESKMEILKAIGALGMVEDKPSMLEEVADAGLLSLAKVHPYNREVVASNDRIRGFDDWVEVPRQIAEYLAQDAA